MAGLGCIRLPHASMSEAVVRILGVREGLTSSNKVAVVNSESVQGSNRIQMESAKAESEERIWPNLFCLHELGLMALRLASILFMSCPRPWKLWICLSIRHNVSHSAG